MNKVSRAEVLDFFTKLTEFNSISTSEAYNKDLENCVLFIKTFFEREFKNSLELCRLVRLKNYKPLLIVKIKSRSAKAKTIGIYGHYDVQPEDPVTEWNTDPFRLVNQNKKFYGRGTADNKGHITLNIFSVLDLVRSGKNKNNYIFILEGEEESGNEEGLEQMLRSQKKVLSDVSAFFLTDVGMFDRNKPQIYYALRGIVCFELEIQVGKRDLHSGVYGNLALNPANIISDYIAKLKDPYTNKVGIKGFYNDVKKFSKTEIEQLKVACRTKDQLLKETGLFTIVDINKDNLYLSSKILPSLDINGLWSGFTGSGFKTVIPAKAGVKFSCRLVEFQKADKVEGLIQNFTENYFKEKDGIKYQLSLLAKAEPFYTDVNNEVIIKTAKVLKQVFGNKVIYNRSGGSIPAAEIFQRLFKKPIVLTGFTLPDDNIHSPNENFDEEMFWKGLEALTEIYQNL